MEPLNWDYAGGTWLAQENNIFYIITWCSGELYRVRAEKAARIIAGRYAPDLAAAKEVVESWRGAL